MNAKREHNYQRKIARLIAAGRITPKPGGVTRVDVDHQAACGFHVGRRCNCDPAIRVDGQVVQETVDAA